MKKRVLAILLCAMMVMTLLPTVAFAAPGELFTVDNLKYEVLTEPTGSEAGTVKLTGYSVNPTAISVGTVQNGGKSYKVTEVGDSAFDSCTDLTSLSLPEAETIGNNAFELCRSLASIDLPKVKTIGSNAFLQCDPLTSLNLPEAETIGNNAFELCSSLASIDLPKVTTIGERAFKDCHSLASVTILQTTAPSLETDVFVFVPPNCTLYVPLNATGYTSYGWPSNNIVSMFPVMGTVYDINGDPAADITVSAGGHDFTTATDGSYTAFVMPGFTGDVTATLGGESKSISLSNVSTELTGKDFLFGTVVATPTFNPSGSVLVDGQSVTIDCGTLGATIRYTTDGSEPTATSTEYTGAISLTDTTTIKAKAFKTNLADSETAEASYTLEFSVTLPSGTGYTATAEPGSESPVEKGGNYSFKVTLDDNYEKGADFVVKANDTPLTPSDNIYTVSNITSAQEITVEGVVLKGADYTAVDEALGKIPDDLSNYTDETVKAVNDAKSAVIRNKDITEQTIVDDYATAINNAVAALQYKGADYSKVDEAINKIPSDLSSYTDETVKTVNDAKNAVIRNKDITEQTTVDGYAKAINNAVSSLEKKQVEPQSTQTGDNSNIALWITLLFISGSAAAVLGISQKRKKAK